MDKLMSDSDAGWLATGGVIATAVIGLIRALKADPNKALETQVEERKLHLKEDEQEAEQAERAADALMALLRETRSMLREERELRREWQDSANALHQSNEALRGEIHALRTEVQALRVEVAGADVLRKELSEARQLLATYRAKEHP
jgi:chromosome segregation ATPase